MSEEINPLHMEIEMNVIKLIAVFLLIINFTHAKQEQSFICEGDFLNAIVTHHKNSNSYTLELSDGTNHYFNINEKDININYGPCQNFSNKTIYLSSFANSKKAEIKTSITSGVMGTRCHGFYDIIKKTLKLQLKKESEPVLLECKIFHMTSFEHSN